MAALASSMGKHDLNLPIRARAAAYTRGGTNQRPLGFPSIPRNLLELQIRAIFSGQERGATSTGADDSGGPFARSLAEASGGHQC